MNTNYKIYRAISMVSFTLAVIYTLIILLRIVVPNVDDFMLKMLMLYVMAAFFQTLANHELLEDIRSKK